MYGRINVPLSSSVMFLVLFDETTTTITWLGCDETDDNCEVDVFDEEAEDDDDDNNDDDDVDDKEDNDDDDSNNGDGGDDVVAALVLAFVNVVGNGDDKDDEIY